MTLPLCSCGAATEFLGNESENGKSWFKCTTEGRVFPLKLTVPPRFGYEVIR